MSRIIFIIPLLLASCVGYQLGGSKPAHLSHVKSIHVPLFKNDTQLIRADSYATNSAVDALTRDGTYKIASSATADAVLEGRVTTLKYRQVSSSRTDTLRSEELSLEITIEWVLRDANDPSRILEKGRSHGSTRFFAGGNLHIARSNALPDALRRACESMTTRIADGF
ncbi:MAG: LptE family protein [Akkermansiaceae bacterium]|nr:LptE family protein [Akkermansiaceae bacterium]